MIFNFMPRLKRVRAEINAVSYSEPVAVSAPFGQEGDRSQADRFCFLRRYVYSPLVRCLMRCVDTGTNGQFTRNLAPSAG